MDLDDLYKVYDGSILQVSDINQSLDDLLFDATNHKEDAENEIKARVKSFLNEEYTRRVNRLMASKIYMQPDFVKLMNAFYRYMHSLGKYKILVFAGVPKEQELQGVTNFLEVYSRFRTVFAETRLKIAKESFHGQYPTEDILRGELFHWREYIRTEMCNDGFDCNVIWKKMVEFLCSLAMIDTMLCELS